MITITGATGNYGRLVIDFLLKKGYQAGQIRAVLRDRSKGEDLMKKGVKIAVGNYDDYNSLLTAFAGTDKLLFISGSDVARRGKQHENVVAAAKECGVKHIVYTSFQRINDTETSPIALVARAHIDTEKQIKLSGMDYTILKNTLYLDGLPSFLGNNVAETGIFFPAGKGSGAFATRSDMAEATSEVLKGRGHENKDYLFSNSESVTFSDIADLLSGIFGKTIKYTDPGNQLFRETMAVAGLPEPVIAIFAGFGAAISQGEFSGTGFDLEKLLGRNPASVKEFLTNYYSSNR